MKKLYIISIVIGVGIAAYFYLVNFDNMSETELLNSVLFWFFPLVFGLYGFAAEKLASLEQSNANEKRAVLVGQVLGKSFGLIGVAILLPFFFVKNKSSVVVALAGSLCWLILLAIFILAIFPSL